MWLHVPGLFTRIIPAMVRPRKASSDNKRTDLAVLGMARTVVSAPEGIPAAGGSRIVPMAMGRLPWAGSIACDPAAVANSGHAPQQTGGGAS